MLIAHSDDIEGNVDGVFWLKESYEKRILQNIENLLRQHRTKTALLALHTICLHIFRHITQLLLANRQIGCTQSMHSDEKSDCSTHAQSLCGITLNLYLGSGA